MVSNYFMLTSGRCPSGDDPFTAEDETNCHRKSQIANGKGKK